jgi:hypothetical protein
VKRQQLTAVGRCSLGEHDNRLAEFQVFADSLVQRRDRMTPPAFDV